MNPEAREYLDKILTKPPVTLTKDEIAFMKARISYLNKAQLDEYDSVLSQTPKGTVNKNDKKEK